MTISKTIPKAGRSYTVNSNGAADVSAQYQVVLDEPLDLDELPTSFTGVPAIGAAHPSRRGYYVTKYEVSQPDSAAKNTLNITVKYGPADIDDDPGGGTAGSIQYVTEWGWDDGTGETELVTARDTNATPVLNSAGDVFDSVPTVSIPTPTFTKVIRSSMRQSYAQYLCTVNQAAVTIGDMVCPARTLLCTVAEKKLIGEEHFPYQYTIHLKYRSNKVKEGRAETPTEIGWDVAIVDAGMREWDSETAALRLITQPMGESGVPATVTTPDLLDGQGKKQDRGGTDVISPFILVFQAYPRTSFPQWFYSEPPTPAPPPPSNN